MYKNNLPSNPTTKESATLDLVPGARSYLRKAAPEGLASRGAESVGGRRYEEALRRLEAERELSSLSTMVRA